MFKSCAFVLLCIKKSPDDNRTPIKLRFFVYTNVFLFRDIQNEDDQMLSFNIHEFTLYFKDVDDFIGVHSGNISSIFDDY